MSMWQRNALCERLGVDRPIIQAPMAGSTTPQLAAAVSNAGGLGSLGLATSAIEDADRQIAAFKSLSNRSLNANFFCHAEPGDLAAAGTAMRERLKPYYAAHGLGEVPHPSLPYRSFGPEHLELIRRYRPRVVSFHFGLPPDDLFRAVKEAGAVVLSSATTVAEARWLEARGVDVVIAQGLEAGGHRGLFLANDPASQVGLFALLPQVARAVRVPVVAAGGIADGQSIAAALVLGASGVQLGTAFLRCPEASVHPEHRAALASATDDATRITRLFSGRPNRVMRTRFMDEMRDAEHLAAPFPSQITLMAPLRQDPGKMDFLSHLAGQAAPLTRDMPAADLVRTLIAETEARFARFR
jgi:nitronate monooxygenase